MRLLMLNTRTLLCPIVLSLLVACGGEPKTPANPPEPASTPSAPAPEPAAPVAATPAPTAETPAPVPAPEAVPVKLAIAPMKFTPAKGIPFKAFELKSDGAIAVNGKTVAKINGDHVEDKDGKTIGTVKPDNSFDGEMGTSKFVGDEFVADAGPKLSVSDDGTATQSLPVGQPAPLGKFEGASSAKKTAALALATVMYTQMAGKASAVKPAGAKPATDKKAATPTTDKKPAPKK